VLKLQKTLPQQKDWVLLPGWEEQIQHCYPMRAAVARQQRLELGSVHIFVAAVCPTSCYEIRQVEYGNRVSDIWQQTNVQSKRIQIRRKLELIDFLVASSAEQGFRL
jgi:hypothetical protein